MILGWASSGMKTIPSLHLLTWCMFTNIMETTWDEPCCSGSYAIKIMFEWSLSMCLNASLNIPQSFKICSILWVFSNSPSGWWFQPWYFLENTQWCYSCGLFPPSIFCPSLFKWCLIKLSFVTFCLFFFSNTTNVISSLAQQYCQNWLFWWCSSIKSYKGYFPWHPSSI